MFARSRRPTQEHQADWYFIERITESKKDYRVECRVDAVYAATVNDAVAIASHRVPVRPNQRLQAYVCLQPHQRMLAMTLHREKNEQNEEFERFMESVVAH